LLDTLLLVEVINASLNTLTALGVAYIATLNRRNGNGN
jgi:hypothetical protein